MPFQNQCFTGFISKIRGRQYVICHAPESESHLNQFKFICDRIPHRHDGNNQRQHVPAVPADGHHGPDGILIDVVMHFICYHDSRLLSCQKIILYFQTPYQA